MAAQGGYTCIALRGSGLGRIAGVPGAMSPPAEHRHAGRSDRCAGRRPLRGRRCAGARCCVRRQQARAPVNVARGELCSSRGSVYTGSAPSATPHTEQRRAWRDAVSGLGSLARSRGLRCQQHRHDEQRHEFRVPPSAGSRNWRQGSLLPAQSLGLAVRGHAVLAAISVPREHRKRCLRAPIGQTRLASRRDLKTSNRVRDQRLPQRDHQPCKTTCRGASLGRRKRWPFCHGQDWNVPFTVCSVGTLRPCLQHRRAGYGCTSAAKQPRGMCATCPRL